MITGAVLIGGFLFRYANKYIEKVVDYILKHITLKLFIFIMVIVIGLISSIITAIIAALFLVEIIEMLPISRENKIRINIISCFSIGLGSILTPIGEPLATIIATKLNLDFWYMMTQIGIYIIPTVIMLGLLGSFYGNKYNVPLDDMKLKIEKQSNSDIVLKAVKLKIKSSEWMKFGIPLGLIIMGVYYIDLFVL